MESILHKQMKNYSQSIIRLGPPDHPHLSGPLAAADAAAGKLKLRAEHKNGLRSTKREILNERPLKGISVGSIKP